jgi:DNA modification methylase
MIPDGAIDAIFTDPPYGLNKEGIYGDKNLDTFYRILPDCYRVLKKDSWFITFFSTKFLPCVFKNNPFSYFWQIIFYSPKAEVKSPIGITKYMSILVFKKGNPKLIQPDKDLFEHIPGTKMIEPDEGFINHPSPKPKHLIIKLLKMFTNKSNLILDPFAGSGSIPVACKLVERNFIGFEIDAKYVKIAEYRLKNVGGEK